MIELNIAVEFSDTPGGRYESEGKFSGEKFRKEFLKPRYMEAIASGDKLSINMDGCFGFPSSFLDESFGELSRELKDKNILDNMQITCYDQPNIVEKIKECIFDERK